MADWQNWADMAEFELGGKGVREKKKKVEKKEEKEKIPFMCESIGHPSLWARCPKTKDF